MSVVQTLQDLYKLNELSKLQPVDKLGEVHRDLICSSLKGLFPQATIEEIQEELLTRGLFNPQESTALTHILKRLEAQQVWQIVNDEFTYLKKLWDGPNMPIYIYPLTKNRPIVEGAEVKKNGVSYNNALFLFISEDLDPVELKALLAHEYHHICRLSYLNRPAHEIELLDTLVMEGMAECAVEKLYGEACLSPWTKRYTQEEVTGLWTKYFLQALTVKDVDNHFVFLYGNETAGLPEWIGYSIGYKLVRSYIENRGVTDQLVLNKTPSTEILHGSAFPSYNGNY